MGSVYLAQSGEDPFVALKVIRQDYSNDPDFRRRFRSEVARAKQVPSYCTAEVLDADPDHDPPYLVVEFVRGPSLNRVVQDQGPLSPANLHGLAIGVATALTGIHGAGVIHRDLKPANVLLSLGGPKVIDFGIARAAESDALTDTASNQLIGTIAYMAPERLDSALGLTLTPAADIFSWGAVVCFAGTGRTPFGGGGIEVAARILTQPPELTGLHGVIRELVERSLAKNPADRPTARQLLDELLGGSSNPKSQGALIEAGSKQAVVEVPIAATEPVTPLLKPEPAPQRRRRRLAVPILATITVLLAGLAGGMATGIIKPFDVLARSNPTFTSPSASVSATPSASPPVSVSPSASPSVTKSSPPPSPIIFIQEALAKPNAYWSEKDDLPKGKCTVSGSLIAEIPAPGTYRCPGDPNEVKNFSAEVEVTLNHAGSCGAIWTRFVGTGYLLEVCHNKYTLYNHLSNGTTFIKGGILPAEAELGKKFTTKIVVNGTGFTLFHNGQRVFEATDDTYAKGSVRLGISVPVNSLQAEEYGVSFNNLVVYDLTP
jgi:serine/threonine protein kinase